MPGLPTLAMFKERAARAEPPIVVGERVFTARWAVVLGVLLSASVVATENMGAEMGRPALPEPAVSALVHTTSTAPEDVDAPTRPYRVEIVDPRTQNRVTSVYMDPKDWPDYEQRRFLRKLIVQADQRAVAHNQVLEIRAMAVAGADQVQAQAFVTQVMREVGVSPDGADGVTVGLQQARDPNDRLGASPCLVATGDLVQCIRAEAEQDAVAPPAVVRRRRTP